MGVDQQTQEVDGSSWTEEQMDNANVSHSIEKQGSLAESFALAMHEYSDRPCLGWRTAPGSSFEWVSYKRFHLDSTALSRSLYELVGPNSGANICICGPNCYSWFVADFACQWAGLASVPISEDWTTPVLQHVFKTIAPAAVICHPSVARKLSDAALEIGCETRIILMPGELRAAVKAR